MTDHRLSLRVPPDDIDVIHEYIDDIWRQHSDVGEIDRMRFTTALVELASNVLQHSAKDSFIAELTTTVDGERIHCEVSDSAPRVDLQFDEFAMPGPDAESGRGIVFIQRLVDELHYERRDNTNVWSIDSARR